MVTGKTQGWNLIHNRVHFKPLAGLEFIFINKFIELAIPQKGWEIPKKVHTILEL